jgi:hypothetical protein
LDIFELAASCDETSCMNIKLTIALTLGFLAISTFLFWKGQGTINFSSSINAERFNQFGGFVAGLLSGASLILLILTYHETTTQTFDNSFYNHLQIHDSITISLRNKEKDIEKLNDDDYKSLFSNNFCATIQEVTLKDDCKDYEKKDPANDYFEILYRILHVRYKYKNQLGQFYKDYNWRIGHYIRSFISIVEMINESKFDKSKQQYHIRVLKARSSNDELRLMFYFVFSIQDNVEQCKIARLFSKHNLFSDLKELIKDDDMLNYNAILKNCNKIK